MDQIAALQKRNAFRTAGAYAVVSWLLIQIAVTIEEPLGLPGWFDTATIYLCIAGFPVAIAAAWLWNSDRNTGTKPRWEAYAILVGLVAVVISIVMFTLPRNSAIVSKESEQLAAGDPATSGKPTVAVLPFVALSDGETDGYFADGLAEEILISLSSLPELLVTARTSSFYFKGQDVPLSEIADLLGVEHLVEGSVRRAGDDVRVAANLVRTSDGVQLWSESYEVTMDDVFEVQSEIAEQVTSALNILLDEGQVALMEGSGVRDPRAYSLYAKGLEFYRTSHTGPLDLEPLAEARVYFDQAAQVAPTMWAAYFTSADLQAHILGNLVSGQPVDTIDPALVESAAEEHQRLLALAYHHAPNDAARDFIDFTRRFFSDDWTGIAELNRRMFEHREACGYAQWPLSLGPQPDAAGAARDFLLHGTRCDAMSARYFRMLAMVELSYGDPAEGLAVAKDAAARLGLGTGLIDITLKAMLALGQFDDADNFLELAALNDNPNNYYRAMVAAARGDVELARASAALIDEQYLSRTQRLGVAARIGDREEANRLARIMDTYPGQAAEFMGLLSYECNCGAAFDLEQTPNFQAQLEHAGLAWPPPRPIEYPLKDW